MCSDAEYWRIVLIFQTDASTPATATPNTWSPNYLGFFQSGTTLWYVVPSGGGRFEPFGWGNADAIPLVTPSPDCWLRMSKSAVSPLKSFELFQAADQKAIGILQRRSAARMETWHRPRVAS